MLPIAIARSSEWVRRAIVLQSSRIRKTTHEFLNSPFPARSRAEENGGCSYVWLATNVVPLNTPPSRNVFLPDDNRAHIGLGTSRVYGLGASCFLHFAGRNPPARQP
jgi:hypothetical protein